MKRPIRVLIVDQYDEGEMYAEAFVARGLTVQVARNAAEALAALAREQPDVIVQGVALPDRSGLDVIREIKANRATSRIPLIALSGISDSPSLTAIDEAGADVIVVKPCYPDDLLQQVRALVSDHRRGVVI